MGILKPGIVLSVVCCWQVGNFKVCRAVPLATIANRMENVKWTEKNCHFSDYLCFLLGFPKRLQDNLSAKSVADNINKGQLPFVSASFRRVLRSLRNQNNNSNNTANWVNSEIKIFTCLTFSRNYQKYKNTNNSQQMLKIVWVFFVVYVNNFFLSVFFGTKRAEYKMWPN